MNSRDRRSVESPEALSVKLNREKIRHLFVALGVSVLMKLEEAVLLPGEECRSEEVFACGNFATATLVIENIDPKRHLDVVCALKAMNDDALDIGDVLRGQCPRSLIEFYSKRAPCSCSRIKHSELLKRPKFGICCSCNQTKEQDSLMVCARCKYAVYCCRACQVADWQSHRADCNSLSAARDRRAV